MLNPSLALPLYQQLADELSAGLQKGDYAVGSRIPSEHELAQRYGLGRPTVRQATEVLVRVHATASDRHPMVYSAGSFFDGGALTPLG